MLGGTDEIVAGIIEKWSAGFRKLDAEALASLYSKSVFFFGSKSLLYRGRQGVADYFNALPRWNSPTVRFDVVTARVNRDVINVAGTASFVVDAIGEPLSVKILGHRARRWRVDNRQPSRLVPDAAAVADGDGRSTGGPFVLRWFLHLFR
jgi:Domain of unknown function (DUF4440)